MNKADDIKNISRAFILNDKNAFGSLVEKYQSSLRRYLICLTNDPCLSDDLAQEAFLKAYMGLGTFKGVAGFRCWLFRIAHNLWIDHLRSRKEFEREDVLNSHPSGMGNGSKSDVSLDLHDALGKLKPDERSVLTLFYLEGMSVKEIAKVISIPSGTVKSHLSRGRISLKKHLTGY